MSEYATRNEVARLEAKIDNLTELMAEVRPLLLAASGERAQIEQLRRDLDQSHNHHRTHFTRISEIREAIRDSRDEERAARDLMHAELSSRLDRMEKREIKLGGVLVGVIFVLQLIAPGVAGALGGVLKALGGFP